MSKNRKLRIGCLIGWLLFSVVWCFANFGHTDSEGFHHGWIFVTRPGWLWVNIAFSNFVILIALVIALFMSRERPEGKG